MSRNRDRRLQKYGKCVNEKCEDYRKAIPVSGEMICPKCKLKLMECPPPPKSTPVWKYAAYGCGALAVVVGGFFGVSALIDTGSSEKDTPESIQDTSAVQDSHLSGESKPQGPKDNNVDAEKIVGEDVKKPSEGNDDENIPSIEQLEAEAAAVADVAKQKAAEREAAAAKAASQKVAEKKKSKTSTTTTQTSTTNTQTPPPPGAINLGYATYTGQTKNGKPHGNGKLVYKQRHRIVSSKDYYAESGDTYEGVFRDGRVNGGPGKWTHNGVVTEIIP